METNARYLATGCLALAVIVAVFSFIFWLNSSGGMSPRVPYLLRFGNNVSGLQPGAVVLFNGVRAGEVSSLKLDPEDPVHVLVKIAVAAGTPLRADTKIGIEAQGLTGTAAVLLEGVSADSPLITGKDGALPTLTAGPEAGRGLSQMAQQALQRLDNILADNTDSFKSTMDNVKSFTAALARNSGRVDAVMAGLERMTAGETAKPPLVFDLNVPKLSGLPGSWPPGQIFIGEPTAVIALQTQRLLTRSPEGQLVVTGSVQWSDTLPKLFQEKLLQSLEDAGVSASLGVPEEGAKTDRQLQIDLRGFNMTAPPDPAAEVTFSATILSGEKHIVKNRVFRETVPCSSTNEIAMVKAMNDAFAKAANDLAVWLSDPNPT